MNKPDLPAINRRTAFAAAGAVGAVGALAAVVNVLPAAVKTSATNAAGKTAADKTAATGGYQLTDHVKQYYATARV